MSNPELPHTLNPSSHPGPSNPFPSPHQPPQNDLRNLRNKVALVTGGGSGIGRATALVLAERGASVVVADINAEAAKEVAADLAARGLEAVSVAADVSDEEQIRRMTATAVTAYGGLDILHNNAALLSPDVLARDRSITEIDGELFARVLRVNVLGYTLSAKHAIPHMLARGGGVIVNTSSAAGIQAELVRPMYGTSKAAILGLTRSIATQYGKQGIRAVGVAPGVVLTPALSDNLTPEQQLGLTRHTLTPRVGTPEDIAYLVAFLASDEAGYITGTTISVDGGFTSHFATYCEELTAAELASVEPRIVPPPAVAEGPLTQPAVR
ncbi:SDR family NAD(P)-dependent oxidoreductase [Streptomyces uncialis]|uniref:SDR family NAD(P)-dependent oxidoreductase n=1 Tax=Streptomyces uncialis TaxID=1048205 RepID=UPI003808715D